MLVLLSMLFTIYAVDTLCANLSTSYIIKAFEFVIFAILVSRVHCRAQCVKYFLESYERSCQGIWGP